MLVQEVSLTTTSMIGLEIMEKNNSEVIQYISCTTFLPHQYYNNLELSPYNVLKSRTVNAFKNHLDAHWEDNPTDV